MHHIQPHNIATARDMLTVVVGESPKQVVSKSVPISSELMLVIKLSNRPVGRQAATYVPFS